MQTEDPKIPEGVQVLRILPADQLVVRYERARYTHEEATEIADGLGTYLRVPAVAVPKDFELAVVRKDRLFTGPEAAARWQAPEGTAGEGPGQGIYTAGAGHDEGAQS